MPNGCSIIDRPAILALNLLTMFLLGLFCTACTDKIWTRVVLHDCLSTNSRIQSLSITGVCKEDEHGE